MKRAKVEYEIEGYSKKDAQLIGRELQKMVEVEEESGIEYLDRTKVFDTIQNTPDHPLRRFFNWDVDHAARQHWLGQTAKLIRSVRVVTLPARPFEAPRTMTVHHMPRAAFARARLRSGHGVYANVEQAVEHDPDVFASVVENQVHLVKMAVRSLSRTSLRKPEHRGLATLVQQLTGAITAYEGRGGAKLTKVVS